MSILLLRISQKEYLERFLNEGHIYMNTLSYFRSLEESNLIGRSDDLEGIAALTHVTWLKLLNTASGKEHTFSVNGNGDFTLNEPIKLKTWYNGLKGNLFCMYSVTRELCQPYWMVEEKALNLGDSYVIILNTQEFLNRLHKAVENKGLPLEFGIVNYYDDSVDHGDLDHFHKSKRFEHQREFRFFIDNPDNSVLELYLGPLNDLAIMGSIDELDRTRFRFFEDKNLFCVETFADSIRGLEQNIGTSEI